MRIEEKDSLEVYYFLQYEQERGMEWVLYKEQNGAATVPGMFCFASEKELNNFRQQYPAFTADCKTASISLVAEALKNAVQMGEDLRPASVNIKANADDILQLEAKKGRPYSLTPVVQAAVATAVAAGEQWVAYNTTFRVLDVEDLFFTNNAAEARMFADEKTNEIDHYSFRQFESLGDFMYQISQGKEPSFFIEQKINNMNNENVEFLHNQMKFAGFGEELNRELVKQLKNDPGEFKLPFSHTFGKDQVEAELNFKKSKESDMYFFNSYDMTVKREGKPDITNTFYINQGQSITMKEAYNLLNGRSVEKEFLRKLSEPEKEQYKAEMKLDKKDRFLPENWEKPPHYKAWVKLDLNFRDDNGNFIQKQFHENFRFNLENSLARLPLRKMNGSEMGELVESLKKGNLAPARFTVDGEDKKFLLAADPQFKAITVYNTDMTLAKKETYSQNTAKAQVQQTSQQEAQAPVQKAAGKDLVPGPEAPWEGKKTEVAQQPAEEKKTDIGKGVKEEQTVSKADLLGKGKEKNGLLPQKEKTYDSKKMKVA